MATREATFGPVDVVVEGHVGLLLMNSPQTMNTLDLAMLGALESALGDLESDPKVRVIVVTGADDKTFMAGGNIAEMNRHQALDYYQEFSLVVHRVFRRFEQCAKPTIAAVNGWALGGGAEFMLCLDIRLVAREAQLGLPEIKLGIFPGGGGTQRLIRQIPLCQAKLLMFAGDKVTAEEAYRVGLINQVVERDALRAEAMALAGRLAEKSPTAMRLLKRCVAEGAEMPLAGALAHEAALISLTFDTKDAHESMSAFLEKRIPTITGG